MRWRSPRGSLELDVIGHEICDRGLPRGADSRRAAPARADLAPVWTGVNTIVGAGLSVVLAYEAGLRGAAMTMRHFRTSPEQLAGHEATPHTDVFYLAYFVCELVTGREPYPTAGALDYMRAVTDGRADVPADLPREVAAALAPDPAARPSLRALRDALHVMAP